MNKKLSVAISVCIIAIVGVFWTSLMHNISRLYELLFLETHYEYFGLFDETYQKELAWGEKIFCLKDYANQEVLAFLHDIEKSPYKKVLWDHRRKLTEEALFGSYHFIVKSAEKKGFFRNLFSMGMAVNVWNNAHWAKDRGLPVLKPIALIEKRTCSKSKAFIVYLFEGRVCQSVMQETEAIFPKIQDLETLLMQKQVIHHDFRLRNMVLLEDGTLQFIDIDKLHWYPNNSYVFRQRLKREVKKFNLNLIEVTDSSKRLEV